MEAVGVSSDGCRCRHGLSTRLDNQKAPPRRISAIKNPVKYKLNIVEQRGQILVRDIGHNQLIRAGLIISICRSVVMSSVLLVLWFVELGRANF